MKMEASQELKELGKKVEKEYLVIDRLLTEMQKAVIGQPYMVNRLLIGLLAGGHILLEGVPGLAKTLAIKTLSLCIDATFNRIQFTPDLLPADITGTMIFNPGNNNFVVRKGPLFANFVLSDEINRAPAKVQSALLEAMQEKQVTIGESTLPLPSPFLVMATQNPLDQEGTYPLPEAQCDRFMLKIVVGYPNREEEKKIVRAVTNQMSTPVIKPIVSIEEVNRIRKLIGQIYIDERIENYIVDIVFATRYPDRYKLEKLKPLISYGGSPRASINLALAARAHAFLEKRAYVIPDDVKAIAPDVLRHRLGLSYEAEAESMDATSIVDQILATIIVP